jgi:hypothetical protein
MHQENRSYTKRLGARVFSEANDLKRTPEALAIDLQWDLNDIVKIINGDADPQMGRKLLFEMAARYPISLRDIWVEPDDTNDGVIVVTGEGSALTTRVFNRANKQGELTPYYEYRDTAMSRLAPYRPEWIRELRHVTNCDPNNPDVAFNNGHILHQLTFFIGHVNFYWKIGKKRYSREMNTGDSALITPFVPHSFTTRSLDPKNQGLIIAVTYRGNVNRAAEDLSRFTIEDMNKLSGNLRDPVSAFTARVERVLHSESLSVEELETRLTSLGLSDSRAKELAHIACIPNGDGIRALSSALNVNVSDLWVYPMTSADEVTITHSCENSSRSFPDQASSLCHISELARSKRQPHQRSFDIELTGAKKTNLMPGFKHHLHEYLFNYGDLPIELFWGADKHIQLAPAASAYISPLKEHWLQGPKKARVLMVRVAGSLTDEMLNEFSSFAQAGKERALMETKQWF